MRQIEFKCDFVFIIHVKHISIMPSCDGNGGKARVNFEFKMTSIIFYFFSSLKTRIGISSSGISKTLLSSRLLIHSMILYMLTVS